MRSVVPVLVFAAGLTALLYGVWQLSHAWAFIVGGLAVVVAAWLGEFSSEAG